MTTMFDRIGLLFLYQVNMDLIKVFICLLINKTFQGFNFQYYHITIRFFVITDDSLKRLTIRTGIYIKNIP